MLMENYLNAKIDKSYSFQGSEVISFKRMIREIVADIKDNKKIDSIDKYLVLTALIFFILAMIFLVFLVY